MTIPNSVTSIGNSAFDYNINYIYYNSKASYTFGSYVREVYYGDDITIVYPIGSKLTSLNKVVLGKNVEYIRQEAFKDADLHTFYITGEKDIYLYPNVFQNVKLSNCTLYVPKSRTEYYRTTTPWNEFGQIMDLDGNELPNVTKKQCAAPTIAYSDGKLIYHSDTEGAEIVSEVRVDDAKISYGFEVPLSATYNITAYAKKNGYDDSEVVTATLVWIDAQLTTDAPTDVQTVKPRPILVSSNDGNVKITGLEDNETVDVYSLSGTKLNTVKSAFGAASFNDEKGNIVIVKIGDRNIKVAVK